MASGSAVPAQHIHDFGKISRKDFPDHFVFGTGTSAYQHEGGAEEGGRGSSIWDDFTLNNPERIADESNGNDAADMYNKYKEDIKMMKKLGFDAYRFSISWSRILPRGRICYGVNEEGINFYNDILDTLSKYGMEPYVTLFHWDLPSELENEYRGFLSKNIINDFRDFAELCFEQFGEKVKYWITLNEPWTYCVQGYVDCIFPPSKKLEESEDSDSGSDSKDESCDNENNVVKVINCYRGSNRLQGIFNPDSNPAKDVYTVGRNMLLSHAAAVQSYRAKYQEYQQGHIGITLVSHWFEPLHHTVADRRAAKRALDFMLGWFLEPVLSGHYPESMINFVPFENLKSFSTNESKLLKGSIDFLGLNYYTAHYAAHYPNPRHKKGYHDDQHVTIPQEKDEELIGETTDLKWLYIVPWGIYKLLKYINNTYNNHTYNLPAIYITENGFAEKNDPELTVSEACRDEARVKYHQDHLGNILQAMKENVKVNGYFAWSWCDNFEWNYGYTVRFGIIHVDYEDEFKRHQKDSAKWFSKFFRRRSGTRR